MATSTLAGTRLTSRVAGPSCKSPARARGGPGDQTDLPTRHNWRSTRSCFDDIDTNTTPDVEFMQTVHTIATQSHSKSRVLNYALAHQYVASRALNRGRIIMPVAHKQQQQRHVEKRNDRILDPSCRGVWRKGRSGRGCIRMSQFTLSFEVISTNFRRLHRCNLQLRRITTCVTEAATWMNNITSPTTLNFCIAIPFEY
jgi:hypothetical protein